MASLALGIAGAAIGSFFGPLGSSVGWALGAGVGNWLTGGKGQDGPKLSDLTLQNSAYGVPIPIGWGTKRIAGNVIDQTDLTPHAHSQSGGKGGGSTTTTTSYTASLLIQLADCTYLDSNGALVNEPIKGVLRVWANGRLIYGPGSPSDAIPMTVYYGTEDQEPDPTFEAVRGAGDQPSYLGKAYVVLTDWDLTQFGNAIPALEFEVQFSGDVGLEYYSLWPVDFDYPENSSTYSHPYTLSGVDSTSTPGVLTLHRYRSGDYYGPGTGTGDDSTIYYDQSQFDLYGNLLEAAPQNSVTISGVTSDIKVVPSMNNGICYAHWQQSVNCVPELGPLAGDTSVNTFAWLKDGEVTYTPSREEMCLASSGNGAIVGEIFAGDVALGISCGLLYWDGYVYAVGSDGALDSLKVRRYPAPDGVCYARTHDAQYDLADYSLDTAASMPASLVLGNDGYLYCTISYFGTPLDPDVIGGHGIKLIKLDWNLNFVGAWYGSDISDILGASSEFSGVEWNGYWVTNNPGFSAKPGTPGYGAYNYSMWRMAVGEPGMSGTLTYVDVIDAEGVANSDSPPTINDFSPLVQIYGQPLGVFRGGILTFGNSYITLGEIVGSISSRVGYDATQYDVSQLTDLVRGYVIADRMTGRAAIDALRPVYSFGAVESNFAVKFRKWTGEVDATIDDDDLGAHAADADPVDQDSVTRALESEIPRQVDAAFCNVDMDYQIGHQIRQRDATESELKVAVEMPVVLTPAEALQAADVIMLNAWVERDKFRNQLPRKWAHLEPTDVVSIKGRARRIVNKDEQDYTHIVIDSVAAVTSVFVTAPTPSPALGFVQPAVPSLNTTDLLLLDLPLLEDEDLEGYYAAMAGRTSAAWPGATLFKSIDEGANYSGVGSVSAAGVIGTATTALGDWTGGYLLDEVNTVRVRLTPGSADLVSASRLAVYNGANMAVLGSEDNGYEVFQYVNAVLVSLTGTNTRVYELSCLLRGLRGTEQLTGTHEINDNFAVAQFNAGGLSSESTSERLYKAVTTGGSLSNSIAVGFSNHRQALECYAPVQLGGGRDGAGDITLSWVRRTRIGGAWLNNTEEVPLSEPDERYNLIVYDDDTYTNPVFQVVVEDAPQYEYLAAQQTLDFGSPQAIVYFEVGQLGSYGEGYYTRGQA